MRDQDTFERTTRTRFVPLHETNGCAGGQGRASEDIADAGALLAFLACAASGFLVGFLVGWML